LSAKIAESIDSRELKIAFLADADRLMRMLSSTKQVSEDKSAQISSLESGLQPLKEDVKRERSLEDVNGLVSFVRKKR
jgi:hypothetical protein